MIRFVAVTAAVAAVSIAAVTTPATAVETRASAAAKFKKEFAASDTNHDGVLSRAEVLARVDHMKVGPGTPDTVHAKRLAELWFASADVNKDGKVTLAEAQALLAKTFDRYDANRDGRMSAREGAAAKAQVER